MKVSVTIMIVEDEKSIQELEKKVVGGRLFANYTQFCDQSAVDHSGLLLPFIMAIIVPRRFVLKVSQDLCADYVLVSRSGINIVMSINSRRG